MIFLKEIKGGIAMSKLANDFLTAIGILAEDAVERSGFNKTIEATIINATNASKGDYIISYQGAELTAKGETIYKLNDVV